MRVLVAVKRVIDYNVKIRINAAKKCVEIANVKMSLNPFCEIGVEAAVQLKEAKVAKEIIACSIGPKKSQESIRTALALGADTGIHILTPENVRPDMDLEPLAVAKILKKVVDDVKPDLVITGKQAIDGDYNQTGQILAGLLDWPQSTFISGIQVSDDLKTLETVREIDTGLQKVTSSLPAVVTTDLRLNTPRYASLPNIMKARRKKIKLIKVADTGVDITPRLEFLDVADPPSREAGITVSSVDELLDKLKNEAKVL